jgi:hypothetical protein
MRIHPNVLRQTVTIQAQTGAKTDHGTREFGPPYTSIASYTEKRIRNQTGDRWNYQTEASVLLPLTTPIKVGDLITLYDNEAKTVKDVTYIRDGMGKPMVRKAIL